jgi:hypothetical protein
MPLKHIKYETVTIYDNLTDFIDIIRAILDTGRKLLFAGFGFQSNETLKIETYIDMSYQTFTVKLFTRLNNRVNVLVISRTMIYL